MLTCQLLYVGRYAGRVQRFLCYLTTCRMFGTMLAESRYINAGLSAAVPVAPQTREYIDWQRQLTCVHFIVTVFSAQPGEGGGSIPSPFHSIYPLHSSYVALSFPSPAQLARECYLTTPMLPLSSSLRSCLLVLSVCHSRSLIAFLSA
jgi:hypothetical protein